MLGLDHGIAEPRPRRQHDLHRLGRFLFALRQQLFVRLQSRLALSLARARALPDPLKLAFERALARLLALAFLRKPFLFLLEPAGVIALIGNALAAIELEDPARDVIEEIAVMGDGDDRA